jgi:hypothetical protein
MTGILSLITGLVSGIGGLFGGLFGGGFSELLAQITENLVTVLLLLFAVGLGVFAITYLNRRRRTLDQQRMAALIKGLHYAGVAHDVLARPRQDSRDHLLSGLRWLFGAFGISSAMYGYESLQPAATHLDAMSGALIGLIPAGLGIAHLVFSRMSARRPASSAVMVRSGVPAYRVASYRPAGRRI